MAFKLYLGISGKMGSGKTTLSDGLIQELSSGLPIERVSLAKPIKDVQNLIYDSLGLEMIGEKDRDLLIKLGMWGRDKDPDLWLKQAVKKFKKSKAKIVICDDVRFENEADWFTNNGLLVRITGKQRGDNVNMEYKDSTSETALDNYNFEYTVSNTISVDDMLLSVLQFIDMHLEKTKEELVNTRLNGG